MYKYELTLVLVPDLNEEDAKAEFTRVTDRLTSFGGVVEKVDEWGKRRLAYEINKINDGIYYIVYFDGEPHTPNDLEQWLRINEKVVRYLIVRVDA
ncbi:30S ribosomal protein S6 [Clostridia bacterium]|nr:30S ribosomal protein S6 [Clostridia bacterium]